MMRWIGVAVAAIAFPAAGVTFAPRGDEPGASSNAALAYWPAWQGFDVEFRDLLRDRVVFGENRESPDDNLASALAARQTLIEAVIEATKIERCDFGIGRDGPVSQLTHLPLMQASARLLVADARRLRALGAHRAAEDRLLALARIVGHLSREGIVVSARLASIYATEVKVEIGAYRVIAPLSPESKAELTRVLWSWPADDPLGICEALEREARAVRSTVLAQRAVQRDGPTGRSVSLVGFPRIADWEDEQVERESGEIVEQVGALASALRRRAMGEARRIVTVNRADGASELSRVWFSYALEKAVDDFERGYASVDSLRRNYPARESPGVAPASPVPGERAARPMTLDPDVPALARRIGEEVEWSRVRAGVLAACTRLSSAVAAGDADRYLESVDRANPFFEAEQLDWAKDIASRTPERFEFTPIFGIAPATRPDGSVEFTVRVSWTMPTTGPANVPERSTAVEFRAMFTERDGSWRYAGEALEELKTSAAVIRYPKGHDDTARDIAAAFPRAKRHVDEGFGLAIDRVEQITLYDSRAVLQFTVYPSMFQTDTTLSGWSEPGQSIKFLTNYTRGQAGWTAAFAHEYGHVATWEIGPHAASMPWWVQEGVAELASEAFMASWLRERPGRTVRELAAKGELPTWDRLSDYRTVEADLRLLPYLQGHHFIGWLSERRGRDARNRWLGLMARDGKPLDEATLEAFGEPFADLDLAWRRAVAGQAEKNASPPGNPW